MPIVKLIGAAIDQCAGVMGAADTPEFLAQILKQDEVYFDQILRYVGDGHDVKNLSAYYKDLANCVRLVLKNDMLPLVVGGDHSCAIGTWSGVAADCVSRSKSLGLIWIDAHMDCHTPQTSESGNIHGMPLATLLGYGYKELTSVLQSIEKLHPLNVVLIGVRSYEKPEQELLQQLGVKVYYNYDISALGFAKVFSESWQYLAGRVDKIGLSVDVDGFDPFFTPGVGTTVVDGINFQHFIQEFVKVDTSKLAALEITETNIRLDVDNKTAYCVRDIINAALSLS